VVPTSTPAQVVPTSTPTSVPSSTTGTTNSSASKNNTLPVNEECLLIGSDIYFDFSSLASETDYVVYEEIINTVYRFNLCKYLAKTCEDGTIHATGEYYFGSPEINPLPKT
jgi:hypothetical protein